MIKKKRNKSIIILSASIMLLFCSCLVSHKNNSPGYENQLVRLIESKSIDDYRFQIRYPLIKYKDSIEVRTCYLRMIGSEELLGFVKENKNNVTPILVKFLRNEKYDWVSNLLLHEVTNTPAWDMKPYAPNKFEQWRMEQKEEDTQFWQKKYNQ